MNNKKIKYIYLTDYAVDVRYPDFIQSPPSLNELHQAFYSVIEIKKLVLSLLKF